MKPFSLTFEIEQKFKHLEDLLKGYRRILIAYSGGVDSSLLLKVATDVLGRNALGVIGDSPSLARRELDEAVELAEKYNLPYTRIETNEMEDESYVSNPSDRCYFCKKELFSEIFDYAAANGFQYIADGSNMDDDGDYRPGRKAAQELRVVSPLKEAGLNKAEVRELAKYLNLPTWNKPALACLSSRFPTGTRITAGKLKQVEKAEEFLHSLGFKILRVRHHDKLARIEVSPEEIAKIVEEETRRRITEYFRSIGYDFVSVDLNGYRQGSLNRLIRIEAVDETN